MPGLLIIAHAPLASALRDAAMHAFPEAAQAIAVYDVLPNASAETGLAEATALLTAMEDKETLILTDVFGATPCNIARHLAGRPGVRVVAGVNVPMIWKCNSGGAALGNPRSCPGRCRVTKVRVT